MVPDTSSADQLLAQWQGQIVPRSFNAGFVTLSYVVSLIGAASTLELINRRTAPKGRINHLLLISAAVTMGGIAIWCMHYIGNRAIDIGDGNPQLQIAYSGGFTALSFFMPIIVLLAAFVAIGTNERVSWWRVAVGGTLAGAAICGMHYLGNASINNYVCIYNVPNVVGAALIAVAASIIALSVFFVLRSSWTNSWWKRGMSAVLLAGAVSGMHWCASTGTQYKLVSLAGTDQLSRNTTVIVVICLSIGACVIMAGFAMYAARLRQHYASKAQQVVLAAAVFDKHGRVLVSTDGLLPSEKITKTFLERTPQDSFTVAHPLFHWVFQVSRNWSSITSIIGGITNHLGHLPHTGRDNISGDIKLITDHGELIENYDIIFRELFCAAAAGLADQLKTPLTNVGILWDQIIATGGGHAVQQAPVRRCQQDVERSVSEGDNLGSRKESLPEGPTTSGSVSEDQAEKGLVRQQISELGRGSLMFLVRRVESNSEVQALTAAGYRFAELHQVSGIIGSSMQIKTWGFEDKLRDMAGYAEENRIMEPGVHVALFGVRARVNNAYGFDVLARRDARNLLPAVQMPLARLDAWQLTFLRQLERMTPSQIVRRLNSLQNLSPKEVTFASQLTDSIEALRGWLEDKVFDEAVLCPRTVEVPCRPVSPGSGPGTCTVITFRIVISIHMHVESPQCGFVPLNLFKVHQLVYKDSPNHLVFTRSVHRDIAPIINAVPLATHPTKPKALALGHTRRTSVRDGRITDRIFRLPRPHTSGGSTRGGGAVDSDGKPIPMVLRRIDSGAASDQTTSTLKLWNGRHSGEETSPGSDHAGYERSLGSSPPPAYGTDEQQPHTVPQSPMSTASSASPMPYHHHHQQQQHHHHHHHQHQQQPSSFGGIMVSQEITVNVRPAGDMSDVPARHSPVSSRHRSAEQSRPLIQRRGSEGGPQYHHHLHQAGPTGEANTPSPAEMKRPGAELGTAAAAAAHYPGGPSATVSSGGGVPTAGIEMKPLAAHRTSVHIGAGVQVSNVEAEKLTEVPTFVDELVGFCVEAR